MYLLPKIHKTPARVRFIVASYSCSTNPLSDRIFRNFKMIFNTVESFHKKGFFYLGCKKFWVVQNSFPIATMINKINVKKKSLSTFECSTFYTTTLDKLLIKVFILNECFQALMTFDDNEFLTYFKNIYPKELGIKVERQGNHVSFLDLDIKVEDSVFVYKPLDKRDKFSLSIVQMPHLSINIPSTISSGAIFSELL